MGFNLAVNSRMGNASSIVDPRISFNFNLMKVSSIFLVSYGHYFKDYGMLWVPVTVGLLIFSYSSGYFTAAKYHGNFSHREFWRNKFRRLGINLLIVNFFLTLLFVYQGRSGIVSWYSIVNLIGLNGFLNWFGIPNLSPFGAGMWFFTLLLLFYLVYPFLANMKNNTFTLWVGVFICSAFFLDYNFHMGHSLWLTACGFLTGVWFQKANIKIPFVLSAFSCVMIFILMTGANYAFHVNRLNFLFILLFSVSLIHACIQVKVPKWLRSPVFFYTGCILEIYLIHGYFFYTFTGIRHFDFILLTPDTL